jgi:hypothetical protein
MPSRIKVIANMLLAREAGLSRQQGVHRLLASLLGGVFIHWHRKVERAGTLCNVASHQASLSGWNCSFPCSSDHPQAAI